MDGNVDGVATLVGNLDHLLVTIALRHTHQSAELTYAVIDVDDVVAHLKLLYLLQSQRHLTRTRFVALQVVLMEAVENLMVGKEAGTGIDIDKSFVQRLVDGDE